ncbi:MAG: TIGR04283 family arsenosugar biosynthesis glycosyltransferase [Gammaproteobacteria bacterium]|nr:TIGR04283 family arsenosugar biosynthesis glycosyltransferase [Gammaproteobacteria bacterium]
MTRLSIIVPTLNEARHIGELLRDLAALRARGHEVIVVDGGSDDETVASVGTQADACVRAAAGRASQMNHGASLASGDVLWFVHADNRVPADAADAICDALRTGARWGRFDVSLSGGHRALRVVESAMNLRSRITGIATGDQGIFVERALFEAVGRFASQPLMEDIALSTRLRRHARPACIRQPRLATSSRRWERHGTARTILLMWGLRLAYALGVPAERLARLYR